MRNQGVARMVRKRGRGRETACWHRRQDTCVAPSNLETICLASTASVGPENSAEAEARVVRELSRGRCGVLAGLVWLVTAQQCAARRSVPASSQAHAETEFLRESSGGKHVRLDTSRSVVIPDHPTEAID